MKTMTNYKNLRVVPHLIFGRGCVSQLGDVLAPQRKTAGAPIVFLVDDVHEGKPWVDELPVQDTDQLIFVNVDEEPKTIYVDALTEQVRDFCPDGVVGLGGGSTLDLAKAVALMLGNTGSSADYQGWDLLPRPGVYHVGVPTLAGTGAEVSRTTVLTGPVRKLGINSDFTPFKQILMDADLIADAPRDQRFFTAMDCYIHGAESLNGTFINEFARGYAEKSLDLCREVFLGDVPDDEADDKLMVASYFGGMSIAYSQVGVAHALSYGLGFTLGVKHGIGNCIVFDHLDEFYPEHVREFRTMVKRHDIELPRGITAGLDDAAMDEMIGVALGMEPLWENALGPDWRKVMTPAKARELYEKM